MNNTLTQTDHTPSALVDSKRVEGTKVFDTAGKHIGAVQRLVLDKVSGKVVYTVASFGGFLGMGTEEYTIPWNALTYDVGLGGYRTSITPAQLQESPEFARSPDNDFWSDRASERTLYDHYRSPYYWTE